MRPRCSRCSELIKFVGALASDQDELRRKKCSAAHDGARLKRSFMYWSPGSKKGSFPTSAKDDTSEANQEEERRLMYVALTRAEKKCFSHTVVPHVSWLQNRHRAFAIFIRHIQRPGGVRVADPARQNNLFRLVSRYAWCLDCHSNAQRRKLFTKTMASLAKCKNATRHYCGRWRVRG